MGSSSLSCLKHCDVLVHLLREWEDSSVGHYQLSVDPGRDLEAVTHELMLMVSESAFC